MSNIIIYQYITEDKTFGSFFSGVASVTLTQPTNSEFFIAKLL